jgi:hypothetical protein
MKHTKLALAILALVTSHVVFGADNSIYIDQSGDSSTITMTQDGTGNRIRGIQSQGAGDTTPAVLKGNNVTLTVDQIGSGNKLALGFDVGTANGGVDTLVKYKVLGNDAVASINMNSAGTSVSMSNIIDIQQSGNAAIATLAMLGTGNNLTVVQSGGNNNKIIADVQANNVTATVSNTGGGGNETTLTMTSDNSTALVTTVGSTNKTTIEQSGGGMLGQYAKVDVNGSGNTIGINQSGTVDNHTDIRVVGSSNTYIIRQKN